MQDFGSFINLKATYISNSLMDIYLPHTTALLLLAAYVAIRLWRKSHN